jgi:GxxExxY protein
MQMDEGDARLLEPVTEQIIRYAFRVAKALGHGFVAKIYENALAHEMRKSGLGVAQQRGIVVFYDEVIVGGCTADLIVEDQVIVELKVVCALSDVHVPQCRNYLRATGKLLCLLINFGRPKVEIRRITPSLACSLPSFACSVPSLACSLPSFACSVPSLACSLAQA